MTANYSQVGLTNTAECVLIAVSPHAPCMGCSGLQIVHVVQQRSYIALVAGSIVLALVTCCVC